MAVHESQRRHRDPLADNGGFELDALGHTDFESPQEFSTAYPWAFLLAAEHRGRAPQVTAHARAHMVRSLSEANVWQSVSVGRDADCDVVITHRRVSRHHALFERDSRAGDYLLLDRGSHNGTRVDGARLQPMVPRRLRSGMRIDFGGIEFCFLSARDLFERLREMPQAAARKVIPWKP